VTGPFAFGRWRGSAAEFHGRSVDDPVSAAVWEFEVAAPALVIGSAQSDTTVDRHAAAAAGVEVVRRRSGGGAVLLEPGDVVWFDVVVPADNLRAAGVADDIAASMIWLGRRVVAALAKLGIGSEVHDGPMVTTAWSQTVCFDGRGPGEIVTDAGKLVGISQRRTRVAARFQCAVHTAWRPERLVTLLAPPAPTLTDLRPVATLDPQVAAALPGLLPTFLH